MAKVTIEVDERDVARWEEGVVELLADRLQKRAADEIVTQARARALATFDETAKAKVASLVDDLMTNGWPEMSPYGEPTDRRWSARQAIVDALKTEVSSGYNQRRETLIAKLVREGVERVATKEFHEIFEEAKTKLRAAVDDTIKARLAETLKSALGLR